MSENKSKNKFFRLLSYSGNYKYLTILGCILSALSAISLLIPFIYIWDVENESKIQKALSTLIKNKTVIIIAHRMRTIANADKIIVLDDGKVVEQGSPEVLLENNGLFKHMVDLQKISDTWEI